MDGRVELKRLEQFEPSETIERLEQLERLEPEVVEGLTLNLEPPKRIERLMTVRVMKVEIEMAHRSTCTSKTFIWNKSKAVFPKTGNTWIQEGTGLRSPPV